MNDFKQWLARKLLNAASYLLQTRFAFDAQRRWKFNNDWTQPVHDADQRAVEKGHGQ